MNEHDKKTAQIALLLVTELQKTGKKLAILETEDAGLFATRKGDISTVELISKDGSRSIMTFNRYVMLSHEPVISEDNVCLAR